jgi:hypothetical protein
MSTIANILQHIQETEALIAEYEGAALRPGSPSSLLVNLRSLEKLKRQLEREFEELAAREKMDVYRYRLLLDESRPPLVAIAKPWTQFQALFSAIYDAIKHGATNTSRRMVQQDVLATQFHFAFTFPGSVGVVLTLPSSLGGDSETDYLVESTNTLFEMAKASTAEEVKSFVERLGVPPVVKLNRWVKAHVAFDSGAGIDWRTRTLLVQKQEFKQLRDVIKKVSEPTVIEQVMPGLLLGASIAKHIFDMRLDTGEEISGKFTDAITLENTVVLPKRYSAVIRKTTQIKEATEQLDVSYFLVRLGRQLKM